jgi:hypothetical protein
MILRDRPAAADGELEITPEMIEAGVKELALSDPHDTPSSIARAVFQAMDALAKIHRP